MRHTEIRYDALNATVVGKGGKKLFGGLIQAVTEKVTA